jgi:hypothetical protein
VKIAKPLLLVTTPIGVIGGIHEGYRLAGGLVFLMVALLLMISAAIGMLVLTVRREAAEAEAARAAVDGTSPSTSTPPASPAERSAPLEPTAASLPAGPRADA